MTYTNTLILWYRGLTVRPLYVTNPWKPSSPWQCLGTAEFTARRIDFGYLLRRSVVKQHKDLVINGSHLWGGTTAMALEAQPAHNPRSALAGCGVWAASAAKQPSWIRGMRVSGGRWDFYQPFLSGASWDSAQPHTPQMWTLKEFTAGNEAQQISQCLKPHTSDPSHLGGVF